MSSLEAGSGRRPTSDRIYGHLLLCGSPQHALSQSGGSNPSEDPRHHLIKAKYAGRSRSGMRIIDDSHPPRHWCPRLRPRAASAERCARRVPKLTFSLSLGLRLGRPCPFLPWVLAKVEQEGIGLLNRIRRPEYFFREAVKVLRCHILQGGVGLHIVLVCSADQFLRAFARCAP